MKRFKILIQLIHSAEHSKKNNYVIQSKHFEFGATEDALCWYKILQEIFEEKKTVMI